MIRNIIFDWSGTLVDDLPAVWQATNYVLAQAGRAELSVEKFRAEFCLPFTRFYARHTPEVSMAQLELWFHKRFREVEHEITELPHARDFLVFCRKRGVRSFLLSTIHRDHYKAQTAVNGFDSFIDRPYVEAWNKMERIHQLVDENGAAPAETLFIGDMTHDIETAKHGGVHSCAVLTGYNTRAQLESADPDLLVENLRELRMLLESNDMRMQPREALS